MKFIFKLCQLNSRKIHSDGAYGTFLKQYLNFLEKTFKSMFTFPILCYQGTKILSKILEKF